MDQPPRIDLFCKVVDNYGDIGVCWRFAKNLRSGHGCAVRLFVDDFSVFKKIERRLDVNREIQNIEGVTVIAWNADTIAAHYDTPADAVIEAFACTLPDDVLNAIRQAEIKPVWIDLEYLSAEDWVESHHAIPSPHPSMPVEKTLFFPGFTPRTGGLIRESSLCHERDAFQGSRQIENAWRRSAGMPDRDAGFIDISLFCYGDAPIESLASILLPGPRKPRIFAPDGVVPSEIAGRIRPVLHPLPFLTPDDYDRLLWACDVNFVRGEDSFVRAQWAARPMVWHIYPQAKNQHFVKLGAFLNRYCANLDPECTDLLENFMILWNERGRNITGPLERIGPVWLEKLPRFAEHAKTWAEQQVKQDDLATQLVRFIRQQQKQKGL